MNQPVPSLRFLGLHSARLVRSHWGILCVLLVWAFAPLLALLIYIGNHGGVWTGASGGDPLDQFQYLAWTRDAGTHFLASNLWTIGHPIHDYLHPMYAISGLLWRLGASVQLAYLVWKPVAVFVLFLGCAAYVRHSLPGSRWRQTAALVIALFYASPVFALASWTGHLSEGHRFVLRILTNDPDTALYTWNFEHSAITVGLMPGFLIATERLLDSSAQSRQASRRWTTLAAAAGLLVSWLHPWQGLTLLGIIAGLCVAKPPRKRYVTLTVPAVATLLPLIYGRLLVSEDPSWHAFQHQLAMYNTAPWWALIASFGPLVAFAALGVRRSLEDRELILVFWVLAATAIYFFVPYFPSHALAGLPLPLAVLAVRGWERARRRARVAARTVGAAAIAAVLAVTVPAAVYNAQGIRNDLSNNDLAAYFMRQLLILNPDQRAAVEYINHAPRPGGVLAPSLLSMSVAPLTGRQVYAGHQNWQAGSSAEVAARFFDPALNDPSGASRRSLLKATRATYVIADCGAPASLAAAISPVARPVKRFGCLTVYETRRAGRP